MIHIKNGLLVDGTGAPPYLGDVLVEGDRIQEVSPVPLGELDAQTVDAGGRVVCPGFIDAHRHCDLAALYDPEFGKLELAQGITTAIMGNCGLAPAPCVPEHREELYQFLAPCLGEAPGDSFFPTVSQFIQVLEKQGAPLNVGVLGCTGAITTAVKGYGNQPFTEETRRKAEFYVRDTMEAGAFGLSCGIMYPPECYSSTEDFAFLAGIAGEYGGYLTSHIRGEGNSLSQSVEEVLRIGKLGNVGVNISHFKVTGLRNHGWGLEKAIGILEAAREQGQDVTADAYPYSAGSTTILSLIPPSVLEQAGGDVPGLLSTARGQRLLDEELKKDFPDWDNMVFSIGWERIYISSLWNGQDRSLEGLSFSQAAEKEGVSEVEIFCRLFESQEGRVGVILQSMAEQDVKRVLCLPWVSLISDALYGGGGMPHPRLYGSFPKFLREFVREKRVLSLETAIAKMTSQPAKRLGLKDRGILAPGYGADLLIFDPGEFTDRATFENPKQQAVGLWKVLVNGKEPSARTGRCLKRT